MRVLLTGGAGFIGLHVLARLLARGHEVRVLDSLRADVHRGRPWQPPAGVEFQRGDVRDRGRRVDELHEVRGAADLREALAIAEPRGDGRHVDGRADERELDGGLEDARVRVAVEVLGLQDLEDAVERVAIEQHGREDGGFGVEIVDRAKLERMEGRDAILGGVFGKRRARVRDIDAIVSFGRIVSHNPLLEPLRAARVAVRLVGDAKLPRGVTEAVQDAAGTVWDLDDARNDPAGEPARPAAAS